MKGIEIGGISYHNGISLNGGGFEVSVLTQGEFWLVMEVKGEEIPLPSMFNWPIIRSMCSLSSASILMQWTVLFAAQILAGHCWGTRWMFIIPSAIFVLWNVLTCGLALFKRDQALTRFHAAEHMVVNCIGAGKEITYENVCASSYFSTRCSSTLFFCIFLTNLLSCLLLWKTGNWAAMIIIGQISGLEIARFITMHDYKWLSYLACLPQLSLCTTPNCEEIEIAIMAGRQLLSLLKEER